MHTITPYATTVTLFSHAGPVATYPSMRAAYRALGYAWIAAHVGPEFRVFSHCCSDGRGLAWTRHYDTFAYVLRDDAGRRLVAADFDDFRRKAQWQPKLLQYAGSRWRRRVRYYRTLATTNERRWATPVREDGEPAPRAARNLRNLPDAWDDYCESNRKNDNWKRYRRHQWR